MPQHVEVNGQIVEFPDGMSPAEMEAAIKKNALTIPKAAAPQTSGMSDFLTALGHHAMSLPHGAAQLIENAVGGAANKLAPGSSIARSINSVVDSDNNAMKQRESDYQGGTPNSPSSYAGATLGEIAPFLIGGPAKALQGIGDAAASLLPKAAPKLVGRSVSGAAQSATVAAAQPVGSATTMSDLVTEKQQPSYWEEKRGQVEGGSAFGAAVPVVGSLVRGAVGGVANAARPVLAPKSVVSPLLQKMTGNDPALLEQLRNPQQLVPGSMPTTAQIIATPQAVATEKVFGNSAVGKPLMAERANANNDARIAAIQSIAKTPDDIKAALAARTAATDDWTNKVTGKLVTGAPVDAAPVISQLQDLQGSSLGTDPVVGKAAKDLLDSLNGGVALTGKGDNLIRPDLLDGYRQNVRKFLQQHSSTGAVASKQEAAFEPVRGAIVDSIESANPGYRDYLATYADKSQPLNSMEAAGGILDNVAGDSRSANSSGVPQVTLTRYAAALKKALNGPYGIDPEAQKTLEAVQADLQRESTSSGLRSSGSDTAYNLEAPGWLSRQLYGQNFTGSPAAARVVASTAGGIGGWLAGGVAGAGGGAVLGNSLMNKAAAFGQSRVNDVFAKAMTDPEFAAQLLAEANAQKPPGLLMQQPQIAGLLGP